MVGQLSLFGGKRQRGLRPPKAKEFVLHVLVADILRKWGTTGWRWTHLPFGEKRNVITGARLKRMGAQRGWPDFILLSPYPPTVHFLELKREGAALTDEQGELSEWLLLHGYKYAVADNFRDAVNILRDWGAVRASVAI
jgi:hypothetical protein